VARYRASADFEKKLAKILPLFVERDLGRVDAEKLLEFGLDPGERRLTVTVGSQELSFVMGKKTYGGSATYLRQLPDGPVFLLSSALERSLDIRAPRYLERRLVPLAAADVDAILVSSQQKEKKRLLSKKKQERADKWIAEDPEDDNALFGNWVAKLFKLSAIEYLEKDPSPQPTIGVRLVFIQGKKSKDELQLASRPKPDGKKEYFARSTFTGQWVLLRAADADSLLSDLNAILDTD